MKILLCLFNTSMEWDWTWNWKYLIWIAMFIIAWLVFWIWLEYTVMKNTNLHALLHPQYYDALDLKLPMSHTEMERTAVGKQIAAGSSIVICGLARDIKDKLIRTIPRIEHIGSQFSRYRVIIFENDSSDGTRELLKEWAATNPNIVILDCCQDGNCDCKLKKASSYAGGCLAKSRIERMAEFRNRYLAEIQRNYANWDWLLVSDFDLEGPCSIDGLYQSLTYKEYDGIVLNGRFGVPGTLGLCTMTYDSLAYIDIDTPLDQIPTSITYKDLVKKLLKMNYKLSTGNDVIPVKSAFNGMALYRISSIQKKQARYYPLGNCEHIGFHVNLKMGINKGWICYVGFQGMRDFSDWSW